jgi:hypothetical protein
MNRLMYESSPAPSRPAHGPISTGASSATTSPPPPPPPLTWEDGTAMHRPRSNALRTYPIPSMYQSWSICSILAMT